MKKSQNLNKYIFWGIFISLIFLSYSILKPFLISLISAFILAFLLKPVYDKLSKKFNRTISALISVGLALLAIIIPALLLTQRLINEISNNLSISTIKTYIAHLIKLPLLKSISIDTESLAREISLIVLSTTKSALTHLPGMILTIFITIIGIYYILKNWDFLSEELENYLPFKNKKKISKEIGEATKNIIFGYILIAIIEFFIASIGFYFSGVSNFLLLSLLIAFLAFVPSLGPLIVWVPLMAFYFLMGDYSATIGILITGLILSLGIDNLLGPKLVGSRSKIHPFIMLIGILGGISVFGLFGFIIGPLILVYTIKILEETTK